MSKFIGSICPVCEKEIQKEEEIVVCPICGAPYHRECYKIENKCLFENTLHQENKDYELKYPEKEKKENSQTTYDEYNQCPRCGAKNPSNGIYCNVCGSPLDTEFAKQSQQNGTQSPFNQIPYSPFGSPFAGIDPEEEIAGEKAKDITGIVKINTQYYLPVFKLIDGKRIKYKFNFSAFLFPSVYFLYRKVWYMAILSLVITLCLNSITFIDMFYYIATGLPAFNTTQTFSTVLSALSFFNFGYMIFCGFSANKLYFTNVISKLKKIRNVTKTKEDYYEVINKKSGTSLKSVLFTYGTIFLVIMIVITIIISVIPGAMENYANYINLLY